MDFGKGYAPTTYRYILQPTKASGILSPFLPHPPMHCANLSSVKRNLPSVFSLFRGGYFPFLFPLFPSCLSPFSHCRGKRGTNEGGKDLCFGEGHFFLSSSGADSGDARQQVKVTSHGGWDFLLATKNGSIALFCFLYTAFFCHEFVSCSILWYLPSPRCCEK